MQLRHLSITYPDHGDDHLVAYYCPECGELHNDVVVDYLEASLEEETATVLGPGICALPLLASLSLDFASKSMGVNAELNAFEWRSTLSCLPALRTLRLRGLSHGLAPARQLDWGQPFSGAELSMDLPLLATAFEAMPALEAVELELREWLPGAVEVAVDTFAVASAIPLRGSWSRGPGHQFCVVLARADAAEAADA
jgi:hypothetical protein